MKENEFYLRDTRSDVGSTCMFWAKGGHGYTSDLDKAEIFNKEEAQEYADQQRHFIPLSKTEVDKVTTTRVDMQYLDECTDFSQGVIIHRSVGEYDGNDIYFDDGMGGRTPNYEKAKLHSPEKALALLANRSGSVLSKSFLDSIKRRTVQAHNICLTKMVKEAGINYTKPRKKTSISSSGKHRLNCCSCGKLFWDFNPYEELCIDCKHY